MSKPDLPSMPMSQGELERHIRDAFPDADILFEDLAGDNDHWSVTIKSQNFNGISRVAQHKLVYAALQGKMGGQLHALQLKTEAKN